MHSINIDLFPHQLLKLTTFIVSLIILIQHIDLTSIQFRLTPTPTHTSLCNIPGPCSLTPTYLQAFSFCLRVKKKIILKINKICHISHLIPVNNLTLYLKWGPNFFLCLYPLIPTTSTYLCCFLPLSIQTLKKKKIVR